MKQAFEIRDVNGIPDPVVENEPVFFSDLDSNSKYRKELQALHSEYEDVVSRLNQLESEPNKTKTKSSAPETYYFKKTHSSKGHKVEFTAEQMEQHLLEIII